jgi:nitronate monooxygenase
MNPWTDTSFTRRLGVDYPIVQGPFGRGSSSVRLAAAVSNAGGLGSFGANDLGPEDVFKTAVEIRKLTDKPFSLNLWVSTFDEGGDTLGEATYERVIKILTPYYRQLGVTPPPKPKDIARDFQEQVAALIEACPPVFSFVFGIPPLPILRACREKGIVTIGGATTPDEAVALESAGVDMVVASGFEAAGHRASFLRSAEDSLVGTFSLIPQIADKIHVPVIAAGGIADGRGVAAALTLGADAVQIGTAFLACEESGAHPLHREALFHAEAKDTVLTRAPTGRLARGIVNQFAAEMNSHAADFAPYPAQSWAIGPLRAAALAQGRTDLVNFWAGQSASLLRYHKAGELFHSLVRQTEEVLAAHSECKLVT